MTPNVLTAQRVLDELKKCGITHIVWLPDIVASFMYDELMSQDEITLVKVCREGEAVAIAAGLTLGGKKPTVLHQNSGLYDSGDSIRDMALSLQLPVLLIIGYRGWRRDTPMTDTCAKFTEPILNAWGIKYYFLETDEDVERISMAYKETLETNRPVAILITRETYR